MTGKPKSRQAAKDAPQGASWVRLKVETLKQADVSVQGKGTPES
jgi:hypothetical protein